MFEVSPLREQDLGPAQERHRKKEFGKRSNVSHHQVCILAKRKVLVQPLLRIYF